MNTSDSSRLLRVTVLRIARIVTRFVITLILAMLLCRWLNTTSAGLFVTGFLPPAFWEWYVPLWERLLGVQNSGMAEQLHDAELLGVFVACLIICAAITCSFECVYRRLRRPSRRARAGAT